MSDDRIRDITETEGTRSGISGGTIIAIIALVAVVAFVLQNTAEATFTVFLWDFEMPVWLLAIILFLLGWLVGYYSKTRRVAAKRKALS